MKLFPGTYPAHIKSYGVGKPQGKAKRAPIFVQFEIVNHETGEAGTIYYWGSLEDKVNPEATKHPYQITIDNLIKMGFKGENPYDIADNNPLALNSIMEYELVLADNVHNGKTDLRIKYINIPGERAQGVKETMSAQEAKSLAGFNFAGAVMAAKAAAKKAGTLPADTSPEVDMSDIPF